MTNTMTPGPPSVYDYPNGHLNHLPPEHAEALDVFKERCKSEGYYTPATDTTRATHTDETLLRFLRARKFVPKDALQQFEATEHWRKEQDLDHWYDTIDVEEFEETRRLYTQWTGRRDRWGVPLYVLRIGQLDAKTISAAETTTSSAPTTLSPKLRRLFATYEHLTSFVMPLCTAIPSRPYPTTPISQTCNIVDISGVGIRQLLALKSHLQDASTLASAHYPETLGRTFIVGAPAFFGTVWSWLQGWFDPGTFAKIFILSAGEMKGTLGKFVEKENLPERYGGELEWDFGDLPKLDEEILETLRLKDGRREIPKGSIRWREKGTEEENKMEAWALGTVQGKQREELVGYIPSDVFWRCVAKPDTSTGS